MADNTNLRHDDFSILAPQGGSKSSRCMILSSGNEEGYSRSFERRSRAQGCAVRDLRSRFYISLTSLRDCKLRRQSNLQERNIKIPADCINASSPHTFLHSQLTQSKVTLLQLPQKTYLLGKYSIPNCTELSM